MFDLVVAYRIYPGVSRTPAFFCDDKLALSEMCLKSFKSALGTLRVKLLVLLDGCPPKYEELVKRTFDNCNLEIISLSGLGNLATFSLQIDILTKEAAAKYVYFAEDDYFYLPHALERMVEFIQKNKDVDFVTPYDHPDSYDTSSRFEQHVLRPFNGNYWRTASSTCLTFLTKRETLIRAQSIFRTYSRGNMDCSLWLTLTQKLGLANPRVHFSDSLHFKIWAKTWFWGMRQIVLGKAYQLWTPIPSLATHMESSRLAPIINWHDLFISAAAEMRQQ